MTASFFIPLKISGKIKAFGVLLLLTYDFTKLDLSISKLSDSTGRNYASNNQGEWI